MRHGAHLHIHWRRRALLSTLPLVLLLAPLGVAAALLPREVLDELFGLTLLSFPGGRFVTLLPVAEEDLFFSPLFIAGLVTVVEACIALFVSINLDLLYRVPWVGTSLHRMEARDRRLLDRHAWIRRTTEAGLVLFLTLPLPATGAVSGTLLARLVGLGFARSFVVVVLGNGLGALALALTAETAIEWVPSGEESELVAALRAAAVIAIIVLVSWYGHRRVRRRG